MEREDDCAEGERIAAKTNFKRQKGGDSVTPERFESLRDDFLIHEARIIDHKRGEYSSGNDRLQNFREVAEFMGQRPSEVALAYLLKHIQSIVLAVRTGKYSWSWHTDHGEGLKQRIADARNYLLLLAACLEEENEHVREEEGTT